jgi:hypothetical protein
MGLRESLGDVSADLAKILNQLKDIQKVQKEIDKGATAYSKAVGAVSGGGGGGRSSNGAPTPTFSTPPPSPGSQLGGVTSSSSGYSSQRYEEGKTSGMPGWARAAALTGAAAVTYGYNVTPGVEDVYAFQRMKFRASFLGPSGYNQDYYKDSKALFGNMQTDPYGMMTAANIFTMTGQGQGTGNFSRVMRETAVTSAIFGQDNATAAVAQASMNSGSIASRMAKYNIYVSDFQTGNARGLGALVDQIWSRHYGSSNRAIPYESVAASIRGGWLGVFINKNFGDVPELREQITQALLMKAQQNGDRLDYSDLGNYGGGAAKMPMAPGTRSAMGAATGAGLTPENDPGLTNMALQSSRGNVMDATSEDLLEGYRAMAYTAVRINDVITSVTDSGNMFIDFMMNLKGAFQTLSSLGELSPIMGFLSGGLFGGLKALMGFSAGGDISAAVGTSTSDSIPAMLSRGEYVINARAAQAIGVDRLNALNSLGHNFGSGFASPTRHFAGGGLAGQSTLDGWTAVDYGDASLKKYSVSGAPGIETGGLSLREADGIGQYLADLAAAWQAHPALGGGRADLNKGWSGGHSLRESPLGGISNHSAGVAIDLRADLYPLGTTNMTKEELGAVNSLLQRFSKLEWGGEWSGGAADQMHFEIRDPKTWGVGGHSPGESGPGPSSTPVAETPEGTMRSNGSAGVLTLLGGLRGQRATVDGFSSFSGGASGLGIGRGGFSWFGMKAASLMGAVAGVSSSQVGDAKSSSGDQSGSPASSHPSPGSGSGDKWLYDFLVAKGLRGDQLKTVWTIGRRESGGTPNLIAAMSRGRFEYPKIPDDMDLGSEYWRGGYYDVGLFQINSQHLAKVRAQFNGDMRTMVDPNNNFEMLKNFSNNFTKWTDWGITGVTSKGFSYIDWSTWDRNGNMWETTYGPATERNDATYLSAYDKINVHGYSEGAYRTHEGVAKLHEGEMVLPATVAEQFRQMMRSASGPGSGGQQTVNINLKIERASDEEAERFAKRVKKLLDEDNWATAVRSA